MIAEKMIVETRSSGDFGSDIETHGWRFEIDGLDTVGELRPMHKFHRGTTISLRVKADFKEALLSDQFADFLSELVAKSPCNLEIRAPRFARSVAPGWMSDSEGWTKKILREQFSGDSEPRFRSREEAQLEAEKRWLPIRDVAQTRLRFLCSKERQLPDDVGSFRISLPYYELQNGVSLVFLSEDGDAILPLPNAKSCVLGEGRVSISWRGFNIDDPQSLYRRELLRSLPAIVEVDFVTGAKISVNREHLTLSNRMALTKFLSGEVVSLFAEFLRLQANSPYAAIALSVWQEGQFGYALPGYADSICWWAFPMNASTTDDRRLLWRRIKFPAILREEEDADRLPEATLKRNNLADELALLSTNENDLSPLPNLQPSRLVFLDRPTPELAAIYHEDAIEQQEAFLPAKLSPIVFPREWSEVAVIETPTRIWVNTHHPTLETTKEAWSEVTQASRSGQTEAILAAAIASKELAAAWFLYNCDEDMSFWRDLKSQKMEHVLGLLDALQVSFWVKWSTDPFDAGLVVVSRQGIEHINGLVRPGIHWAIPMPTDEKSIVQERRNRRK